LDSSIIQPDLNTNLQRLKNDIFASLNCIQIGKISKFDKTTQSAEVEIQVKRQISETESINYPLLVDCPVFFLQGGGAYIEMPVKKNDYCIILFNDRDIDNWFITANVSEPASFRKHNLSDAIVLVGLNPSSSVLSLDNDKIQINAGSYPIELKTTSGILELAVDGSITFNSGTESYILGDTLKTMFTTLCTTIATATSGTTAQNAAGIETIKAAFSTFNGQLSTILSTKIKGA
jgi:hypothetical protein